MANLSKLIEDQEFIIQCLLLRGDEESRMVASRAMDVAATLIAIDENRKQWENILRKGETSGK